MNFGLGVYYRWPWYSPSKHRQQGFLSCW